MTGQDFLNYSSTEGAPSDCSVEAWPCHSEVEEEVEHEATLHHFAEDLRRTMFALFPREKNWDRFR